MVNNKLSKCHNKNRAWLHNNFLFATPLVYIILVLNLLTVRFMFFISFFLPIQPLSIDITLLLSVFLSDPVYFSRFLLSIKFILFNLFIYYFLNSYFSYFHMITRSIEKSVPLLVAELNIANCHTSSQLKKSGMSCYYSLCGNILQGVEFKRHICTCKQLFRCRNTYYL